MTEIASASRPVVGFVGLGKMGLPMTARLHAAGLPVQAWDVSEAARVRATELGIEISSLSKLGAASTVLVLMLPSSVVVDEVLRSDELRAALRPGTLVVDMSSSEPLRTQLLAEDLIVDEVRLMDAPVSGGVRGAESGTLTIMAGGPQETIERARPVLELLGNVVVAGGVGSGHAVKALNNLLSATHLWATSEAMLAGQRFGLDPDRLLSIINLSSGRSGSSELKWPRYIVPRSFDSGFALGLMVKDMRIALGLFEATGTPGPLSSEALSLWARSAEELPDDADHTEIALWLERHSGAER